MATSKKVNAAVTAGDLPALAEALGELLGDLQKVSDAAIAEVYACKTATEAADTVIAETAAAGKAATTATRAAKAATEAAEGMLPAMAQNLQVLGRVAEVEKKVSAATEEVKEIKEGVEVAGEALAKLIPSKEEMEKSFAEMIATAIKAEKEAAVKAATAAREARGWLSRDVTVPVWAAVPLAAFAAIGVGWTGTQVYNLVAVREETGGDNVVTMRRQQG